MATQAQDPILAENEAVRQLKEGYKYGWSDATNYIEKPQRGLSHDVIDQISDRKGEPGWMRAYRHKALNYFLARPMPKWGADLTGIDFDNIYYYIKPTNLVKNWDEMPPEIRDTWDKLGIPEAEKSYLGGVSAQYESEVVYHSTKKELEDLGVIFCDMDTALREHEDIVKEYFRTIIIVDEDSWVHYVEGCSAPVYSSDSLHSAVVEIIVKPRARCRYTTIQNWSNNVYNLVTKRAVAYDHATMEWVDGNLGSKVTMKYPAVWLMGEGAKGEILSVAYAGNGQHQDAGGKVVHAAPNTQSTIISKSISKDGGRAGYRGLVRVEDGATKARSNVRCDALILDEDSRSDTYPYIEIEEETASIGHEATVSRIGDEQLFYLRSRGIDEAEAMSLIVRGFIEPITKELPLEYAVELNRLIQLQMEGSVG